MPKYAILIYGNYGDFFELAGNDSSTIDDLLLSHKRFTIQIAQEGAKLLAGTPLDPAATATSIRGGHELSDGPFINSTESLGGFYLIEANDLDHAISVAKLCPAPHGGVEIRPIADLPEATAAP